MYLYNESNTPEPGNREETLRGSFQREENSWTDKRKREEVLET
jgi:hypothetical protein